MTHRDKLIEDAEHAGLHVDTTHPAIVRVQRVGTGQAYYTVHYNDGTFTEAHRWAANGEPDGNYTTVKAVREELGI